MAKTNVVLYYGNNSPILEVYNLKKHFLKNNIQYADFKYYGQESTNLLVDNLNSTHNTYFVNNGIPMLAKPLNYVICTYLEDGADVVLRGQTDILAAFPAS